MCKIGHMSMQDEEGPKSEPFNKEVGARIVYARERFGVTEEDVARALGVTYRMVSYWERGEKRISLKHAYELADYLNTTVSYLVGDELIDEPARLFTGQIPYMLGRKYG